MTGGSEVYRIDPDGAPRRVWGHAQDVVYAIAFDATGRALLGAGNKGNVYRIESPTLYTSLLSLPVTQVTAFQAGRDGRLFAATGNTGKVYEIGPGLEHEGSIESDVFDSGMYSLWGRLSLRDQSERRAASPSPPAAAIWTGRRKTGARGPRCLPAPRAAAWLLRRRASCSGKPR